MLELLTKMQHSFPFCFSNFIKEYLQLIISMLFNISQGRYKNEKLISAIVIANYKPINTYAYYVDPFEFKGSIYHKKSGN